MSGEVLRLVSKGPDIDAELVAMAEGLLERVRQGKVVALGIVEVESASSVATHYSKGINYHALNSGAARLAARLAMD